jgi:tRNA pseudouridine55 synthase
VIGPGIYLVHKNVGDTSFAFVRSFMEEVRAAGIRRDKLPVCHGGALDPFAEGLLLILAGEAARLMELLHPVPKTYVAEIAWGAETDNGDLHGQVVARGDGAGLTADRLEQAVGEFIGWRDQVPPATSNKHVGGERAYRRAHRGEEVVLPPSRVYLHEARWLQHDLPRSSTLRLVCRGGYYVRALARDLGRALGALGHLTRLRRTAIGPWEDPPRRVHLQGAQLYPWCASREVTEAELALLRAGKGIARSTVSPPAYALPEGFPDPEAPLRGLSRGFIVAMLREREGQIFGAPVLRGPL